MTVAVFALMLVALSPTEEAGETVVRLHVEAMPEPKPALKYQLLPDVRELNPGNPAQNYLKCFMEQRIFFFSEQGTAQRDRYQAMPLSELAAAKVGDFGGNALRQADRAARMIGIDWQVIPQIRDGGTESPPAELGPLQVLALALNVRFRAQVAERRYDDAVRTAKTMFALARHLGEYPAGVANRLGLWVAHLGLGTLKEMVQQPGCPNLYWALAELPCPLVDLRKGVQGDRTRLDAELRPIRGESRMTDAEIEACVGRLSGLIGFARARAGREPRTLRTSLAARAKDAGQLGDARRRIVEAGTARELVDDLPPLQVILLDEKLAFAIRRDERMKALSLPIWQIDTPAKGIEGPIDELLPDVARLRRSQRALEQEIALLRHVEALRLHAAEHSGHLPGKLSEIAVPLPDDPFTGRPFDYSVEGDTAHLRGDSHQTGEDDPRPGAHFEVTIRN